MPIFAWLPNSLPILYLAAYFRLDALPTSLPLLPIFCLDAYFRLDALANSLPLCPLSASLPISALMPTFDASIPITALNIRLMTKAEIRKEYLAKRTDIGFWQRNELSQSITDQFLYQFYTNIIAGCNIHLYLPIEKKAEVNTNFLLKMVLNRFRKTKAIVPITDFKSGEMNHFLVDENSIFHENKYGIPEPIDCKIIDAKEIDIVVVPLLAFSESGHRVGYGGGYYDKFLAKTKPSCLFVGFSFFDPINIFGIETTDIQLDYCITPNKIWSFSRKK